MALTETHGGRERDIDIDIDFDIDLDIDLDIDICIVMDNICTYYRLLTKRLPRLAGRSRTGNLHMPHASPEASAVWLRYGTCYSSSVTIREGGRREYCRGLNNWSRVLGYFML